MDSIGWALALIPPLHAVIVATPLIRSDLRFRRLPNRLVLPFLATATGCTALASAVLNEWSRFGMAVLSSCLIFGLGLWLALRQQLGMGDVKLATGLAQSLGWFHPLLPWSALAVAFLLASTQALIRRVPQHIAFGPYLLLGFALSIAWVANRQLPVVELLGWASHGQHVEQYVQLL